MTCDSASSCDLGVYLLALSVHNHSNNESPPTALDTEVLQLPTQASRATDQIDLTSNQQDVPTISLPEEGAPVKSDDQSDEITVRVEYEQPSGEDTHHLQPADEINDEFSDASSCNYPTLCQTRRTGRRVQSGEGIGNATDSEDDDDGGYHNDSGAAYDSDLESVLSKSDRKNHAQKMRKWRTLATGRFEKMLLDCIVNTDKIAPEYRDIHIARSTIDKLEQVTSLSLLRPKAFSYGVLRGNKVTGCILYGPPGTGKSLLARGMARQSGFNMLSISTSEIWQKCHGEDEKMIKAVFSMARKLYPCIVFVDEADAMLGARKAGERRHVRSMLNQFLMEWDGLVTDTEAPFVLLATNRPFDLDPAVLRRAPVQIHLDIPTKEERASILGLLLRDEKLQNVSLGILANMTPNYTGSDLKNLCVMAATNCVNAQPRDMTERVLTRAHFFSALQTIRATNIGKVNANEFKKFEDRLQENGRSSGGNEDED
ncbi:AAA-domain-containing protein [Colletotrichum eremochloae]|nr:AAA-domain-containing protein [Colletotrichum eremochloae]